MLYSDYENIAKCVYTFFENLESVYIYPTPHSIRLESHNIYTSNNIKLRAIILYPHSSLKKCYAEYEFTTKTEIIPQLSPLSPYYYDRAVNFYKQKTSIQHTTAFIDDIDNTDNNNTDYTIKHDKGKPQLALFPKEAMEAVCEIMEFGANKYGQGTWDRVEAIRYINAAARHLYAMQSKDENGKECIDLSKVDSESGLEHLYHLACNVVYATALYKRDKEKCEK